ncbi:hypothetical protein [uncultured Ruminococcus sp.]|uniref:hypothetical protein n=1 Tax=uncultured Ruminococcus sp. TaxID=165186 RepID=UPI002599DE01|nr:hypothetical protein [uncultured Ruminococcus sp.]
MERAVFIPNIEYFEMFRTNSINDLIHRVNLNNKKFIQICQALCAQKFDRIYFGNEFCDELLVSAEEAKTVYNYCCEGKMKFTLVTPYMSDGKLPRLESLLEELNRIHDDAIEVVCNDWGTCSLINEKYHNLKIVVGRLLDKMSKDARFAQSDYESMYDAKALEYLQCSNISTESYKKILDQLHVQSVEIDCPPQGVKLGQVDMNVNLYAPFGFITTGRMCMMRFLSQNGEKKYSLETACAKGCQKYDQNMIKSNHCKRENHFYSVEKCKLYRKGNTVFYLSENYEDIIRNNQSVERLIVEPCIPF